MDFGHTKKKTHDTNHTSYFLLKYKIFGSKIIVFKLAKRFQCFQIIVDGCICYISFCFQHIRLIRKVAFLFGNSAYIACLTAVLVCPLEDSSVLHKNLRRGNPQACLWDEPPLTTFPYLYNCANL